MISCSWANYTWSDQNFCAISPLDFVLKWIALKRQWIKTTSFHYWTVLLFVMVYKVILSIESVDEILKGDNTGDDSQRWFLAQNSVTTLLWHYFKWSKHCSSTAMLCCTKNSCCVEVIKIFVQFHRLTSP